MRTVGTVVSMGTCTKPDFVVPILATFKQVKLLFSMAYSLDEFRFTAEMLDAGHVEPRLMMGQTIALEEVPDMLISMRTRKNNDVKVQVDLFL